MISSLAWVPAGVADPNPKRYEMSRAEQELIQMMQEKGNVDDEQAVAQHEEEEEAAEAVANSDSSSTPSSPKSSTLPPAQASSHDLPADLRMDEYSSEEEDEHKDGVAIGQLLVSTSEVAEFLGEEQRMDDEDEDDNDDDSEADKREDQTPKQPKDADNHQHQSDEEDEDDVDSDDDLADIPDTREYEDVDVEGLQAMGLGNIGMSGGMSGGMMMDEEDDDDDSEAEDVRITADDALIALAKTEEVSGGTGCATTSGWWFIATRVIMSMDLPSCSRVASDPFFLISPLSLIHHFVAFRILLPWKFTFMTRKRGTFTCTMTYPCPPFRCVWLTDK